MIEAEKMDSKAKLVGEICSISAMFVSCTHIPQPRHNGRSRRPVFVDWYQILQIEEDADADLICKRYRQLALLLHPDKNKHPNAESAFKLVSEAYAWLSDKEKRKNFNKERCNSFCTECVNKMMKPQQPNKRSHHGRKSTEEAKPSYGSYRAPKAVRDLKRRMQEEASVIEKYCLRKQKMTTSKDFPLFDPTDHLAFPGYPHHRSVCPHIKTCRESPIFVVLSPTSDSNARRRPGI